MNERIKELAEQSGCKVMDGEWYIPSATGLEKIVYTKRIGLEKFAELIVRDCLDVIKGESFDGSNDSDPYEHGYQHAVLRIQQRIEGNFGVEE